MKHTSIEKYENIFVKREDLCFDFPAPPFSKCRGIIEKLQKLKQEGYDVIGYTETSISMAGWGVAWACKVLGLKCVLFDPQYKVTPEVLKYHRSKWAKLGAETIPILAGMAKVNWYISQKLLQEKYPRNSILLPLGLPFEETIQETSKEVIYCFENQLKFKTIVINVGSGTVCAGIVRGLNKLEILKSDVLIYGIMGRTGNIKEKKEKIKNKAGLLLTNIPELHLIDPGWDYTEKSQVVVPFPCHAYYDAKAWQWLLKNKDFLKDPILFWNIGH